MIDWSIKPIQTSDDAPKIAEYVRLTYDSEKEYRPGLALERSPFYPNLLLTVHNFHFAIWKTDLEGYEKPIFKSMNTQGAHNTCGAFSPTRPGVIGCVWVSLVRVPAQTSKDPGKDTDVIPINDIHRKTSNK